MPELFSRMDNLNWLTPSIADILDQGSTPPGGDGSIRERMLTLQRELDEFDTPARIVNVRSTPSYTLYIARLGTVGRVGNRRTITSQEIKNSIKKVAENHKDWLLGFIPQLRDDDSSVGILLRTEDHRPLSLRRLLVRGTFRKHPSTLAFVMGVTLEQQLIVDSIDEMGHLLVIGTENAKQHFVRSTLLSLIMLNTPSELRIAIAGESSDIYKYLVGAPHALGRTLTSPSEGQRLVDGLVKEIQRRQQSLSDESATNITEYNKMASQTGKSELPRIVLILDSLTDESWQDEAKRWSASISELLTNGKKVGIHLIITADDENNLNLPSHVVDAIDYRIVTRASSKDISANIPNFHVSLLRFIDAFIAKSGEEIVPVELCAISNTEIKNVVEYWREMSKKRFQEIQAQTSQTTGITGVLTSPSELKSRNAAPPTPPTPDKPSVSTLSRATQLLGVQLTPESETQVAESPRIKADAQSTAAKASNVTESQEQNIDSIHASRNELESAADVVTPVNEATTQEIAQPVRNPIEVELQESTILQQAVALSAYLGWISNGALCDIFLLSQEEAQKIIEQLQLDNIVEEGDYSILRFIRLEQSNNGVYKPDQSSIGSTANVHES